MDPLRAAAILGAGALPKENVTIPVSGCPVRHPFPGRVDREHPPADLSRSNADLDNDSLVPDPGGWYRAIAISSSCDRGGGNFATINLFSAADYYRFVQKEDWSTAAGWVANFAQEDDLVLFNSTFVQIPFDYYFEAYEDLYSIQVEKRGLPVDLFDSGAVEPKMTTDDIPRLLSLISGRKRVYLVYSHNWYTDPMGLVPQTLASEMELLGTRNFYGGQVQLHGTP